MTRERIFDQQFSGSATFQSITVQDIVVSGSGGGVTLGPVGSTPNPAGAAISSGQLTLEPASRLFPGVVTSGSQTFSGDKILSGNLSVSRDVLLSNTGQSAGAVGPAGNSIIWGPPVSFNHWEIEALNNSYFRMGNNNSTYLGLRISDGWAYSDFGMEAPVLNATFQSLGLRLGGSRVFWVSSGINGVGTLSVDSQITSALASRTVPAIKMGPVNGALDPSDLILGIQDASLSNVWTVDYTGNVWTSGSQMTSGSLVASGTIRSLGILTASNFNGSLFGNSTNTNSGDVTFGPVGSFGNSNGGTLSGQQIILEPADSINPGVVSNTTQSFVGPKTFLSAGNFSSGILMIGGTQLVDNGTSLTQTHRGINNEYWQAPLFFNTAASGAFSWENLSNFSKLSLDSSQNVYLYSDGTQVLANKSLTLFGAITASNIQGTNTGNVTLGPVGSAPNDSGSLLGIGTGSQTLMLQPFDGTHPGVMTTSAQTIAGVKTFVSVPIVPLTHVRAIRSGGLSMPNGTNTTILFNTEQYDSLLEYDPSTGVFTAGNGGFYSISAAAQCESQAAIAGNSFQIWIYKNNTAVAALSSLMQAEAALNLTMGCAVHTTLQLSRNDTIRIQGVSIGASRNLLADGNANFLAIDQLL